MSLEHAEHSSVAAPSEKTRGHVVKDKVICLVIASHCNERSDALSLAVATGNTQVVDQALKLFGGVNGLDSNGRTAMFVASQHGQIKVVRILCKLGANVQKPRLDKSTPLHAASGAGHKTVVQLLCEFRAVVNVADKDGMTPLHMASLMGHSGVARFLCASGADKSRLDKGGWSALHVALEEDCHEVVRILTGKDGKGSTSKFRDERKPPALQSSGVGRRAKDGSLRGGGGSRAGDAKAEVISNAADSKAAVADRLCETPKQLRLCAEADFGGMKFGESGYAPFQHACSQWVERLERLHPKDSRAVQGAVLNAVESALKCRATVMIAKRDLMYSARKSHLTSNQKWHLESLWQWHSQHRLFGYYSCQCGHIWESGFSYIEASQQCIRCNDWVLAHRFANLENQAKGDNDCKDHNSSRCQACLDGYCDYVPHHKRFGPARRDCYVRR